MDLRRLRVGEMLAGLGGLALLVSTFLPWYAGPAELSAWEAFSVVDVLLALTALTGIAVAVLAARVRAPALPVATAVVLVALSAFMLALAVYRLLNQPGPNDAVDVRPGAYVGLACLFLVAVGAWRSVADERATEPAGAETPARPAPPAAPAVAAPPAGRDPRAP